MSVFYLLSRWRYTNPLLRSFDVCLQRSVTTKTRAPPSEPKKLQFEYALFVIEYFFRQSDVLLLDISHKGDYTLWQQAIYRNSLLP